eukprot:Phypoly_transcript_13362.p1 GENE.Phypoly_transcript_13362~~Phypoly_transcript_13362.p1  ORF type:complete len:319 (+),score=37.74 Phypoly_transcript_13362:33-989(+)
MLCCFKNSVSTIPSSGGSNSSLAKEKSARKLGAKKKSAKQIIPFEVGVSTDANLAQMSNRSSPQMEDATCVQLEHEPGHHFFAVFDGHGGKDVAQYCSQRAHQVFFGVRTEHPDWTVPQVWTQTYATLDKEIQENLSIEDADCEGSTCTTCHLQESSNGKFLISVANVGDSKAILIDDNDLRVLSETHRPTNEQEERRVKSEGGRITGERNKRLNGMTKQNKTKQNNLMKKTTKGLTSTPFVQDIVTVNDSVQSVIVMASDGVCKTPLFFPPPQVTVRSATESATVIADKLKSLALQHRSMDNIAVVVVKIKHKSTAQ